MQKLEKTLTNEKQYPHPLSASLLRLVHKEKPQDTTAATATAKEEVAISLRNVVQEWCKQYATAKPYDERELYKSLLSGTVMNAVEEGQLPLRTLLSWLDSGDRSAPTINLSRALSTDVIALLRSGLPYEQLEAWLYAKEYSPVLERLAQLSTKEENRSAILKTWQTQPHTLEILLSFTLQIPHCVLERLLPYLDTLNPNCLENLRKNITDKYPGFVDYYRCLTTRNEINNMIDNAIAARRAQLSSLEYAPLCEKPLQINQGWQPQPLSSPTNLEMRVTTRPPIPLQPLIDQLVHVYGKSKLDAHADRPLYDQLVRFHYGNALAHRYSEPHDFDALVNKALEQSPVTSKHLYELCLPSPEGRPPIFNRAEDIVYLIKHIVPAIKNKKCDLHEIVNWWQSLETDDLSARATKYGDLGPSHDDLKEWKSKRSTLLYLAHTGIALSTLRQWMQDSAISNKTLKRAFCTSLLAARNALGHTSLTPEQLQDFLHHLSSNVRDDMFNIPLIAVLEGDLSIETFKAWIDGRPAHPTEDAIDAIEKAVRSSSRPQRMRKVLLEALDGRLKKEGEHKAEQIEFIAKIINAQKKVDDKYERMAITPAMLRSALSSISPASASALPIQQVLQKNLTEVSSWLELPASPLTSALIKYQEYLADLQRDVTYGRFNPQAWHDTTCAMERGAIWPLEEIHEVPYRRTLEQRIKMIPGIQENMVNAILEVAKDRAWVGDAGEIMPSRLPQIPGWPAHRMLITELPTGGSQRIGPISEDNIQLDTQTLRIEDAVRIQLRGDHYNAVTADNQLIEIPRDGNCFLNAVLTGLTPAERNTMLGQNPRGLSDALLLRYRFAEFLIANDRAREAVEDVLEKVAIPAPMHTIEPKEKNKNTLSLPSAEDNKAKAQQKKRILSGDMTPFAEHQKRRKDDPDGDAGGFSGPSGSSGPYHYMSTLSQASTLSSSDIKNQSNSGHTHSHHKTLHPAEIIAKYLTPYRFANSASPLVQPTGNPTNTLGSFKQAQFSQRTSPFISAPMSMDSRTQHMIKHAAQNYFASPLDGSMMIRDLAHALPDVPTAEPGQAVKQSLSAQYDDPYSAHHLSPAKHQKYNEPQELQKKSVSALHDKKYQAWRKLRKRKNKLPMQLNNTKHNYSGK